MTDKKLIEARRQTVDIRTRLVALGLTPEVYFDENMQVRVAIDTLDRLTELAEQSRKEDAC